MLFILGCVGGSKEILWTQLDGSVEDFSEVVAAGTADTPAILTLDQPGTLEVAPGIWYVMVLVGADMSLLGVGEGEAILSAGGKGVVVDVVEPVSLSIENMSLTEGFGCLGQAVRAASLTGCEREQVTSVAVALSLKDVDIYNHVFDIGGGAVGVTEGSTVVMENSNIHDNTGHGIYGQMSNVTCKGTEEAHAGLWGNEKNGIWIEVFNENPYSIVSDLCDFGEGAEDNGHEDVGFGETLLMDYGDNASFSCESAAEVCQESLPG